MAGSRSSLDVFLRLHGQRKFAKELSASGAELEAMGLKGAQSMARFAASGEKLKKFGRSWTHNVTLPVAALGAVAGKMAIDFHQSMSLIQTQAGASAKEAHFLEGAVLNMAKNSKFGPHEMADALFRVRSAGFKAKEALDVLHQGSNLSTLGNSDLEMTTKALTGAAKALGLEKTGQLKGLAAEMNAIVGTGDMRMEELQDALSTGVLPAFISAGMGMRDYGSALTVMTDRNVPAIVSSTRLRTAVAMLVPHTKKAEDALKGVGVQGETLANLMRHKGLPATIEYLSSKLDKLSKNKANKVMIEAFGGSKSSATIEMLVQNADELGTKWDLIAGGVGKYQKQIKIAEEQPGFKLQKAWSSIQVALIELGDQLLPLAVPMFEKLAGTFESVAHTFVGLPHNVQLAALGFLLFTGPIASGLGYFAGGIGRALILTQKLAMAGRSLSIFSTAMKAGQGLGGSASMAFGGVGESAALQTAKGFAYSLGPAVAAYGIGNILTSALSGDWKDAGFEAGGAIAGGIAGFMLGGPMGAMLGVGIGSLGGELVSKLFTPNLSPLRREFDHLRSSTESYHRAIAKLPKAEARVDEASKIHRKAMGNERRAHHALIESLVRYGGQSKQTAEAQFRLDRAQRQVAHSAHREHKALSLNKYAARAARQELTKQVSSIKQVLPGLHKRAKLARKEADEAPHRMGLQKKAADLTEREMKLTDRLPKLYKRAKELGGKPWAEQLEHLTSLQGKYGDKGKTLVKRMDETREKMQQLKNMELTQQFREEKTALGELVRQYERINELGAAAPAPAHPNRRGRGAAPAAHPGGRHHGGGHHRPAAPRGRLAFPAPSSMKLDGSLAGVVHVEVVNHNRLELDGKPIAESTTRQAKKAANRE